MTFFAQIINFVILVVLLRAVAYKPVVNMLKAREDRIKESLDKADADAAEADKLLADYKKKLAAANVKAEDIIRNAEKRSCWLITKRSWLLPTSKLRILSATRKSAPAKNARPLVLRRNAKLSR